MEVFPCPKVLVTLSGDSPAVRAQEAQVCRGSYILRQGNWLFFIALIQSPFSLSRRIDLLAVLIKM